MKRAIAMHRAKQTARPTEVVEPLPTGVAAAATNVVDRFGGAYPMPCCQLATGFTSEKMTI